MSERGFTEDEWRQMVYDNLERFSVSTAAGGGNYCGPHGHVRVWAGGSEAKPDRCYCGAVRYERHRCSCGDVHERMVHDVSGNTNAPVYVQQS